MTPLWPYTRSIAAVLLAAVALVSMTLAGAEASPPRSPAVQTTNLLVVKDSFGRVLNDRALTLVDWEGHLANPAVRLSLTSPPGFSGTVTTTVKANCPRLYFNVNSTVAAPGPSKILTYPAPGQTQTIDIGIFPDRDATDEDYTLTITSRDGGSGRDTVRVPIHVVDQDANQAPAFDILVDFSKDQTGFFDDPAKRAIIEAAADDWAYFIGDMNLDPVPAGSELTFIWNPDGFVSGNYSTNASTYTGFLLYVYGIHHAELRSGGEGSFAGGFQSSGGNPLPIKRSGGVEVETQGNYNTLGWYLTTSDDDWWVTGNLGAEANDLYSIVHHEMGHAIAFNTAHTNFSNAQTAGSLSDPDVFAYYGANPAVDASSHFNGTVDPRSLRGVFGYEYFGTVPRKRWTITKGDLLCAKAVGYALRSTSPFVPLALTDGNPADADVWRDYADTLKAEGGLPAYEWSIVSGVLPQGLVFDSFTGAFAGKPTEVGTFPLDVRVRDSAPGTGITMSTSLTVAPLVDVGNPGGVSSLQLSAFAPNPISRVGRIGFWLPRSGQASLEVFNVAGRRVASLQNGDLGAGAHEVTWEPKGLAGGLYFVRLDVNGEQRTQKVVVRR